jgi:hypothetical protein
LWPFFFETGIYLTFYAYKITFKSLGQKVNFAAFYLSERFHRFYYLKFFSMNIYQLNKQATQESVRPVRNWVILGMLLWGLSACGGERREDLQDSGKVSVSDSTTNARTGGSGVGNDGQGYEQEGPQRVETGDSTASDSAGLRNP